MVSQTLFSKCTLELYAKLFESCPILGDPMDYNPRGFSVHGILQARILEEVAISFSRRTSRPNPGLTNCRQSLYHLSQNYKPMKCTPTTPQVETDWHHKCRLGHGQGSVTAFSPPPPFIFLPAEDVHIKNKALENDK